ncbi:MAG: hypothetical protein IPH04_01225 [Saprospirales bacterium]|nr:hypothetical protein [Saprospirales bacterium]
MTFSLFLSLVGIGWLMIYTVGYGEHYKNGLNYFLTQTDVGKQTIWIGICLIAFFFIFIIDRKFWQTFAYPVFGFFPFAFGGGPDLWEGNKGSDLLVCVWWVLLSTLRVGQVWRLYRPGGIYKYV